MKILIVNTSDIEGGAARAAYRLHRSLLTEDVNSQMLVQSKVSNHYTVLGPITFFQKISRYLRHFIDSLPLRLYKNRTKTLFSPAWLPFSSIVSRINALNPDVVHLHWVAGGMLRIEDIAKIKAPTVWSLHDMWPFTGGCHYDEECKAFKKSCGACKVLGSTKQNDLSKNVFLRKKQTYEKKLNVTVIGLSNWLANEARNSILFSEYNVVNLPNPINTSAFAPYDKASARQLLNLPSDKKLILFGAMGATSDQRKGFQQVSDALQKINNQDAELVVFGSSEPETGSPFNQKVHYLGRVYDDVTLRILYSAADVMLVPSLQENLSNAIMESLSCGTPVVAFDVGGNSDMVKHQVNGYLAKYYDTSDLATGIDWVLNHPDPEDLKVAAREKIVTTFDSKIVAQQYIKLYKKVLNQ